MPKFINQENDIVAIIGGFKVIMNHCLRIDDEDENEDNFEELLKDLGKETVNSNAGFTLFGLFGSKKEVQRTDVEKDVKLAVFEEMQQILLACLNCWNDIDTFRVRNYYFTRMGIFGYESLDDKKMEEKIHNFRAKKMRESMPDYLGDFIEQIKPTDKPGGFAQNLIQHERRQTMAAPRDLSEKLASGMRKTMAAKKEQMPMPYQDL